jgi:hypothetical protein
VITIRARSDNVSAALDGDLGSREDEVANLRATCVPSILHQCRTYLSHPLDVHRTRSDVRHSSIVVMEATEDRVPLG